MFTIIPHGAGLVASFSLGQDDMGWRQAKISYKTLCEKVFVRQLA
jgi:hypothetical protein